MNILIVGAGPTGLTAALELSRRGITPEIIDRKDAPSTLSRAVGITPKSLEKLAASGVSKALIAEGIPMAGLRVYRGQDLKLSMPLHSEHSFFPSLLCLAQDRTEAILADALTRKGVTVRYGVELKQLRETRSGIVVDYNDDSENVFDHVIGADGIRSAVRESAGVKYPGYDLAQQWSIADVDLIDWEHPGCLSLFQAGPGRVAVVVPIGKNRYRVVASTANALKTIPIPLAVESIRRESTFAISVRHADTFSTGKIHLAGDAAHCHSPVGGRGMNLGIADAVELARCIAEQQLETYSATRLSEVVPAMNVTERGRKMAEGHQLWRRLAFRGALTAVRMSPSIQTKLGSFVVEF